MFENLLGDSRLMDLPVLGMLFFFAVFAAVIVRVLMRGRSETYRRIARLPLDDGEDGVQ